ncbi:uncharacterized protein LOC112495217 [Cephus cinctus]|uniref:Uncharacterized protein LOC112495217 n=1 Tax=Cephus cinctus TaxID=211228 RepID=A0AAJ7RT90_CEPCN|nr:uncharacterized protein LOC112495217 [Cephus cinctus]XP_024946705.1 uncharacterized protein LOC112495217 [Cephus cinctus]
MPISRSQLHSTTALTFKGNVHFYIPKEPVLYYPTPFVFQRGSAYIDEFNRKIGELTEAGFIRWWISRNHTGSSRKSSTSVEAALKFSQMASVFVLWLIGLLSAVITFLDEITSRRNRKPGSIAYLK